MYFTYTALGKTNVLLISYLLYFFSLVLSLISLLLSLQQPAPHVLSSICAHTIVFLSFLFSASLFTQRNLHVNVHRSAKQVRRQMSYHYICEVFTTQCMHLAYCYISHVSLLFKLITHISSYYLFLLPSDTNFEYKFF